MLAALTGERFYDRGWVFGRWLDGGGWPPTPTATSTPSRDHAVFAVRPPWRTGGYADRVLRTRKVGPDGYDLVGIRRRIGRKGDALGRHALHSHAVSRGGAGPEKLDALS